MAVLSFNNFSHLHNLLDFSQLTAQDISMHYLYNYTQLNEKRIIQMSNNILVSTIQMHVAIMANLSLLIILSELTMMNSIRIFWRQTDKWPGLPLPS